MAVRFLVGRAGSGKTEGCLRGLLKGIDRNPFDAHRLLLVPEQASLQMEQALVGRCEHGAYAGIQVLSFSTLTSRVFDETGGAPTGLPASARRMALRHLSSDNAALRRAFGLAATTAGFVRELDQTITQLIHAALSPADVRGLATGGNPGETPGGTDKRYSACPCPSASGAPTNAGAGDRAAEQLAAISEIYAAYIDWLGPDRVDPAAELRAVCERIGRLEWLAQAEIWVDGFAGFTGLERATLVELAARARQMTITLLLDPAGASFRDPSLPPAEDDLFAPTLRTYQQLRRRLAERGVVVESPTTLKADPPARFAAAPALAELESRWTLPEPTGDRFAPRSGLRTARPGSAPACSDESAPARLDTDDDRGASIAGFQPPPLRLVHAPTHHDEIVAAARHIRTRVAHSGGALRFADFAVIARDLSPLADSVRVVFAEYHIPVFLDQRRPLAAHPLACLLRAAFDAALRDYPPDAMVELLRTDLTPLTRTDSEILETVILVHGARGRACWSQNNPWDFVEARWLRSREDADEALHSNGWPVSRGMHEGRAQIFAGVDALQAPFANNDKPCGAVWANYIFDCLNSLNVRARLNEWIRADAVAGNYESAETHRAAWEAVSEILGDLHDALGTAPLALADVAELVNDALATRTLALAPPALDQVLVSGIERSRHPDIREAWLLACNDGIFPQPPSARSLLHDSAQRVLAAADVDVPRDNAESLHAERLLAYIAFTRASESLTVSWAASGAGGDILTPSRFVRELSEMFPEVVHHLHGGFGSVTTRHEANGDAAIVSLPDAARRIVSSLTAAGADAGADARALRRTQALRSALCSHRVFGDTSGKLLRGLDWTLQPAPIGNFRRQPHWPADIAWWPSASEVELYQQCPYQHFAKYGLRLDAERGPQPLAWDLGSAAHEILATVTRAAIEARGAWNVADWRTALEDALSDYARHLPKDLPQRQPRLSYLRGALGHLLRERVDALAAALTRGTFRPLAAEWTLDETTPLVVAELDADHRVALRGKIDRVDMAPAQPRPLLILRDYKSTPCSLGGSVLTQARLQVWLYVLALEAGAAAFEHGTPAGVLLDPIFPDEECTEKNYYDACDPETQALFPWRPKGAFTRPAADALDPQLRHGQYSPVASMRLKNAKKGCAEREFAANSHIVAEQKFAARLAQARETLLYAAEGLVVGDISIAPLLENKNRACTRCPFGSVCRFESGRFPGRVASKVLPTLFEERKAVEGAGECD